MTSVLVLKIIAFKENHFIIERSTGLSMITLYEGTLSCHLSSVGARSPRTGTESWSLVIVLHHDSNVTVVILDETS